MAIYSDPDNGKAVSAGRAVMLGVAAMLLVCWLAVGLKVGIWSDEWARYSGWLTWGRDFFYGTVAAFVGGKVAGKIGGGGSGS